MISDKEFWLGYILGVICVLIGVAPYIGSSDKEPGKCENVARIELNEAAINELITASESNAQKIEALAGVVIYWNDLFRNLYQKEN